MTARVRIPSPSPRLRTGFRQVFAMAVFVAALNVTVPARAAAAAPAPGPAPALASAHAPMSAAREDGTIRGSVVDPSGQPTPGATVVLRSPAGFVRDTRTDERGAFDFPGVTAGRYDLHVSLDGFRAEPAPVTVAADETAVVAVQLRLSAVTERLVVSAAYVATPLSEVPAGTIALERSDLDARQLSTVAAALGSLPGAAVSANGGLGSVTAVFPRGGESDFTLVLVDGVKLNSFGGGFDFGHLTTAGVSSVEVVRGPQSAVFGADAVGGVVHLRTLVGGAPSLTANVEAGGYGTQRLVLGSAGSHGRFGWGINAERLTSDGWTDPAPGTATPVTNDDYAAWTASASGAWQAAPGTTVRIASRFAANERGYPGPFGSNPIGAFPGIDTVSRGTNHLAMGSASLSHEWNPQTGVRLQGSWMTLDSDFVGPWGDSMSRTRRWAGRAQFDRALGSLVAVSAGADVDVERAESTYITGSALSRIPVDRLGAGYFAEARLRGGSRLMAVAGVRVEQLRRAALDADPFAFTPRPLLPADTIVSSNPRLAVSYYARTSGAASGNWTRLHASAGTGIRPPDAFEIAFTDNPALRPERSASVEGGVEQSLFGGRLVIDGTAYSNTYDDLIVTVGRSFANASRYRSDNIANARARGLEFSAAWRTRFGLDARASYTYVDSEVLALDRAAGTAPPPFSVGDALLRRPRHQGSIDVLLARPAWSVFVRGGARGGALDVEPNYGAFGGVFPLAGFSVVDVGAARRLMPGVDVTFRCENVLDRGYESALGFPAPRRTLTIGLRVAAGR